jgi:hypothetical protein
MTYSKNQIDEMCAEIAGLIDALAYHFDYEGDDADYDDYRHVVALLKLLRQRPDYGYPEWAETYLEAYGEAIREAA